MLPPGMELRPSLQFTDNLFAIGFTGDNVPDPFCHGVEALRGVVTHLAGLPATPALIIDLRNVHEITAPGIYSLKSLRSALREHRLSVVLVVNGRLQHQWLEGTGVTDHMPVVIGEEGLRAWLAQRVEDQITFSEENVRKMIADNFGWEAVEAAMERGLKRK